MPSWMYILECQNGAYYVGKANNLHYRIAEHSGHIASTRHSKYVQAKGFRRLVYFESFATERQALAREAALKHWHPKRYRWGRTTPVREFKEYLVSNFPSWRLETFENTTNDAELIHLLASGEKMGQPQFSPMTPEVWWQLTQKKRRRTAWLQLLFFLAAIVLIAFGLYRNVLGRR